MQDTFPVLSTGKGKEFRALEGALGGGPFVENNLADTLDGVVDMVFFNYQNKSAAEKIFFEWFKPEPTVNPSPNKTPVLQVGSENYCNSNTRNFLRTNRQTLSEAKH